MSPLVLVLLALASMTSLAVARVVRVHYGRTPFPDIEGTYVLVLAFLLGPPIVAGAFASGLGPLGGFLSVPAYLLILVVVAIFMAFGALAGERIAPAGARPLLMVALIGRGADPYAPPIEPALTKPLAESLATVDAANAQFPRGVEFPAQINRAGFRPDWDALDAATRSLEGLIGRDRRMGVSVHSRATTTAADARSRLDTLEGMARVSGQAWAG